MGPRPDGRGRRLLLLRLRGAMLASMGPRPDGRGRSVRSVLSPNHSLLQWGRDRMAAEGLTTCATPTLSVALQWGRDRMAAEGCRLCRRQRVPASFNGAATGWPRKVGRALAVHQAFLELQWGRDRMAAEGGKRSRPVRSCSGFNGAATGWPQKAGHEQPDMRVRRVASMGPRPDGRGRLDDLGVNVEVGRLQWGRDRMAAEGRYIIARRSLQPLASMGPRPDGRGRRPRRPPEPSRPHASMGPRPDGRGRAQVRRSGR